jgi:hypothetical protein
MDLRSTPRHTELTAQYFFTNSTNDKTAWQKDFQRDLSRARIKMFDPKRIVLGIIKNLSWFLDVYDSVLICQFRHGKGEKYWRNRCATLSKKN